jgi:hypothetical protein
MTTAPAAVGEHYDAMRTRGNCQISLELNPFGVDHDGPFYSLG